MRHLWIWDDDDARREAERDASRGCRPDPDLYDRYPIRCDPIVEAYTETYDREKRRQEEEYRRQEERRQERARYLRLEEMRLEEMRLEEMRADAREQEAEDEVDEPPVEERTEAGLDG